MLDLDNLEFIGKLMLGVAVCWKQDLSEGERQDWYLKVDDEKALHKLNHPDYVYRPRQRQLKKKTVAYVELIRYTEDMAPPVSLALAAIPASRLIDLWKAGMREREVMMIYKMNERAKLSIETPAGDTGEVKVQGIVRQGTVFGPKLCCVSTQSVNDIGHSILSLITPEAGIGAPVYVDDILGVGDVLTMERVIDNTRKMEGRKKFKFSKKKSK